MYTPAKLRSTVAKRMPMQVMAVKIALSSIETLLRLTRRYENEPSSSRPTRR